MEGCYCFSGGNSLETGKVSTDNSFWTPKVWVEGTVEEGAVLYEAWKEAQFSHG